MKPSDRWLLAIALVLVDLLIFAVPLTGLAAAWVLIARPPQFREWVLRRYEADCHTMPKRVRWSAATVTMDHLGVLPLATSSGPVPAATTVGSSERETSGSGADAGGGG
jgi:hypothetical protein